ncbi:uncharacterized protein EV422DRAFT_505742 [Fimicolochytrium jonesii]|uniref:uncharacterized protein n=1 Tax=Fimicolochytrium jonesii TaxID=1396493 RepID=UPI0022FE99F8|nr:uncharacterized protein EV422DRAFT_505742 [Fimicolochytrium jonesii]KAI8821610.1 hypothetical protein EV422DRAFT_505742 [Fimicolochytrium jonesii]
MEKKVNRRVSSTIVAEDLEADVCTGFANADVLVDVAAEVGVGVNCAGQARSTNSKSATRCGGRPSERITNSETSYNELRSLSSARARSKIFVERVSSSKYFRMDRAQHKRQTFSSSKGRHFGRTLPSDKVRQITQALRRSRARHTNSHLFSGGADCTIKQWDILSGTLVANFAYLTDWVNAHLVGEQRYSADGPTVKKWDIPSGGRTSTKPYPQCDGSCASNRQGKYVEPLAYPSPNLFVIIGFPDEPPAAPASQGGRF